MESNRYPTDLSDEEWRSISPHLPGPAGQGRPRLHGLRVILEAVFYILQSGCPWQLCPWRLLPRDFPPWKTVYDDWFRKVAHRRDVGASEHRTARAPASACERGLAGTRTPALES
jgi:putative transposase